MTHATIIRLLTVALTFDAPFSAGEFAQREYADSTSWRKRTKRRRAEPGGFVARSVGGVLSRLAKLGLLEKTAERRYFVAQAGRDFFARGGARVEEPNVIAEQPNVTPAPQWIAAPYTPTGWAWWDGCCGHWIPDLYGNMSYTPLPR